MDKVSGKLTVFFEEHIKLITQKEPDVSEIPSGSFCVLQYIQAIIRIFTCVLYTGGFWLTFCYRTVSSDHMPVYPPFRRHQSIQPVFS